MGYSILTSDTHMPAKAKSLPKEFADLAQGAEAIFHTGDFTDLSVVHELNQYAPLYGVQGNNDTWDVMHQYPSIRVVSFQGLRVGMTHGHFGRMRTTPERAREHFSEGEVDVIFFGHSHIPYDGVLAGIRCVNPGSLCDPRRQPFASFAVLTIESNEEGPVLKVDFRYL